MDLSSDLRGIFDFFIFWRKGERGMEWEGTNVNCGFRGLQVTSKLEEG
nr:MAG TPA: hypothetical protein [Caudoviricetes sp.]